ncbi:MAG TPA: secondary thiamine-phosphate synthase enzyme YjbQ [bacterium]|nr:secondary thiamine-phosphate synthase enzyme YjbQ [bacterium]
MKHHRVVITQTTKQREEIVNITREVEKAVRGSGIREGLCLVFPHHTSSAVFLTDSDESVALDLADVLQKCAPAGAGYRHDENDYKKNADGHIKAAMLGHHICLPVSDGQLDFGAYQTVYYAEFDGQRPKEILIKIIGA